MAQQGYITELSAIESVRKRASLFIGGNGVSQLLIEAVLNSIDEILAERNNKVNAFYNIIDNDNIEYICQDWSTNGIPLKTKNGQDGIISIATKLFSGGKYDSSLYFKGSGGTNGLGTLIINSLSKQLIITTLAHDGNNNHIRYTFKNGEFVDKKLIHLKSNDPNSIYSTEVRFIPNKEYFESILVEDKKIVEVLKLARYIFNSDIQLIYKNQLIENTFLDDFKGENCINYIDSEYIDKITKEYCKLGIALYDDFDSGKIFKGIVNSLSVDEGTHKNVAQNLLKNKLFEIAEKNKKHVQLNDLLVPIKILCTIQIKDSQYKEQIKGTLDADKNIISNLIEPVIDNLIKNNKEFFNNVINLAESYRVNLQSSKESKKNKIGKTVIVRGLRDCSSKDKSLRSLYLVEGNSAAGAALKARNPLYDAIIGLRGKILNVLTASKQKILECDVIKSIAGALGYKLYGEIDPDKCRYQYVYIMADADSDGRHIECLLTFDFYILFPQLIEAGMVYVILCPLYGCTVNKQFIPIYTDEERQKYNEQGIITRRFKGLGIYLLRR